MKCTPLKIPGSYLVEIEPLQDERGFFSRTFCRNEFRELGIDFPVAQCSISANPGQYTLRGMHYQADPCPEIKLVRCTAGMIWDCIIDLRPGSTTFRQWEAAELSARNHKALLIPEGCAHGFISLTPDTEVFYMISASFAPACARGVRWNDPAFAIEWPATPVVISEKDRNLPDFVY